MPDTDIIIEEDYLSTPEKKTRLEELTKVIDDNIKGFLRVGAALYEIRESRIYLETHPNFESFCQERWDMGRKHADKIINAKKVNDNLTPIGVKFNEIPIGYLGEGDPQIPQIEMAREDFYADLENLNIGVIQNEAQARPLACLDPKEQRIVWINVLKRAHEEDRKITAAMIEYEVKQYKFGKLLDEERDVKRRIQRDTVVSDDFKQIFNDFLKQVELAKDEKWEKTSKQAVLKHIDQLRKIIQEW